MHTVLLVLAMLAVTPFALGLLLVVLFAGFLVLSALFYLICYGRLP